MKFAQNLDKKTDKTGFQNKSGKLFFAVHGPWTAGNYLSPAAPRNTAHGSGFLYLNFNKYFLFTFAAEN